MPYTNLKRNKDVILNAVEIDNTGKMIAKSDLKIVIPVRYEEANLAVMGASVYSLAIFAIIVGDSYAVNVVPSKVRLFPVEINEVKFNEHGYYELSFEKGSMITDNINLVKDNTLGYYIYNYFIALGKVPWFMGAIDMLNILSKSKEYTGAVYGAGQTIMEMIISMCLRDNVDVMKYWRQTLKNQQEAYTSVPDFAPLRNVPLGARNTTSKLMGAYFDEGLNSALLYPSDTTERVEQLLRQ